LLFDQLNHRPYGRLARIGRQEQLAAQPLTESLTELELLLSRQTGLVKIVVAVRVKKAVGKYRWGECHGLAEQRLQTAAGPCIAAGLDGVRVAQGPVKAASPPREFCSIAGTCR